VKRIFFIVLVLLFQLGMAQDENDIKIFHRLVVVNSENKIMVVKIENTDVWVTPGFYQTSEITIKQGLNDLALSYGVEIKEYNLKGVFILNRNINNKKSSSLRNVFIAHSKNDSFKIPTGIGEVKWLPIEKLSEVITFPHISIMIEKIMNNPNETWGGTLLQYKENNEWKVQILEDFYTI